MAFNIGGSFTTDQIDRLNAISADRVNEQKKKSQILDKDAFLKLMLTQLQHQNPLDPMDNTEYIAQMAQFSSVEQLANIAKQTEDANQLNALISTQLEHLTDLFEKGKISDANMKTLVDQNTKMLNELMKMNQMLSTYFSKEETVTTDAIMSAITK